MLLLASADVHGKQPIYDWLLTVARDRHVDAIVLAGDLLGCPDGFDTPEEAQQHEAAMLTELLSGAGAPVFYIMGNDDLVELNSSVDGVQSIHGRQVRWGRFTFVGYQYSLPFWAARLRNLRPTFRPIWPSSRQRSTRRQSLCRTAPL